MELSSERVVFFPFTGTAVDMGEGAAVNSSLVANQVAFNRGMAMPKIMPGNPEKPSGPPGVSISSV